MLPPEFYNQGPVDYGDLIMKNLRRPGEAQESIVIHIWRKSGRTNQY